jgi:uncharacterized DUF497 family protein
MGPIEGCIALARHAHDIVPNWAIDQDFVVFGAIASSTDHLPFGQIRTRWSATAFRDIRRDCGEAREIGYGVWNRRLYCVVFVSRTRGAVRIISLRKANTREVNAYEEVQARKTHSS